MAKINEVCVRVCSFLYLRACRCAGVTKLLSADPLVKSQNRFNHLELSASRLR